MITDMKLMSVKEIAKLLGVDRASVATWKHQNRLPKPEWLVSGGIPIWTEQTVKEWAKSDNFVQARINKRAQTRLSK